MGWFRRKKDPLSERARDLNRQIASLESQIRAMSQKEHSAATAGTHTSLPSNSPSSHVSTHPDHSVSDSRREPVFEKVSQQRLTDLQPSTVRVNELGVRKYDLPAAWKRFVSQFQSPTASNPKLVDLLAAGSLQGMRPLRYEKRIARRRFVIMFVILLLLLWGIIAIFLPR